MKGSVDNTWGQSPYSQDNLIGILQANNVSRCKGLCQEMRQMPDVRSHKFKEYCDDNNIELRFNSVAHPQENAQAEVANRIILDGHKNRVERSRNISMDELLPILWAYRTTCKVITEVTPLMLAYEAEAVVPLEITHGSPRVEVYEPETNKEGTRLALDLIDEVIDEANARNTEHQRRVPLYYNKKVK
ncbi:uncharacterized protein LOC141708838 [Apium graveolens]|uniref:uncharacterized protein LOC141708838 n=1 Tax=Apium graveolens TaxID=4045 RepID=UPI003D7AD3B8